MTSGESEVPSSMAWLLALRRPEHTVAWDLAAWQRVVRIARPLRLLGRLAEALDFVGLMSGVPEPVRRHLISEQRLSRARLTAVRWVLENLTNSLAGLDCPKVLLKGGAYLGQGLPIAAGRLPSDVDVMVPRSSIARAQAQLIATGWSEPELDAHDRRYYHEWSHEVPPMTHPRFALEVDLHHNILPITGHVRIDAARLFERLQPSALPGWQVLDPVDQVLHSAAHLFFDSELRGRIRDLVDLDGLLCHFAREERFWERLIARATELRLVEPLALACHFCMQWLATPVPSEVRVQLAATGPGLVQRGWLLPLLARVLTPVEPDERASWADGTAATLLLARHHWRRMPLHLLVPHLWRKSRLQLRAYVGGA